MKTEKQHVICDWRCKSCGLCVAVCPKAVLAIGTRLNPDGYAVVEPADPDACVRCDICGTICPDAAIGVVTVGPAREKQAKEAPCRN